MNEQQHNTTFVRTRGGSMIHRRGCGKLGNPLTSSAVDWVWAEHKELSVVREMATALGVKCCSTCQPLVEREGETL